MAVLRACLVERNTFKINGIGPAQDVSTNRALARYVPSCAHVTEGIEWGFCLWRPFGSLVAFIGREAMERPVT